MRVQAWPSGFVPVSTPFSLDFGVSRTWGGGMTKLISPFHPGVPHKQTINLTAGRSRWTTFISGEVLDSRNNVQKRPHSKAAIVRVRRQVPVHVTRWFSSDRSFLSVQQQGTTRGAWLAQWCLIMLPIPIHTLLALSQFQPLSRWAITTKICGYLTGFRPHHHHFSLHKQIFPLNHQQMRLCRWPHRPQLLAVP